MEFYTDVVKTERGWAGHFIGGHDCLFRRNTLLEKGDTRYIVSTIGAYIPVEGEGCVKVNSFGYYETVIFEAMLEDGYWDINVEKEISPPDECAWYIENLEQNSDNEANAMHEKMVDEISRLMETGNI